MESDELRHLDQLGFDEKAETWFIDTSETPRLMLTRSTLGALVQLYNRIHHGNPLLLTDHRTLHRIKEEGGGHEEKPRFLRHPNGRQPRRTCQGRLTRLLSRIAPSLLRRSGP